LPADHFGGDGGRGLRGSGNLRPAVILRRISVFAAVPVNGAGFTAPKQGKRAFERYSSALEIRCQSSEKAKVPPIRVKDDQSRGVAYDGAQGGFRPDHENLLTVCGYAAPMESTPALITIHNRHYGDNYYHAHAFLSQNQAHTCTISRILCCCPVHLKNAKSRGEAAFVKRLIRLRLGWPDEWQW